jgi:hypothetical protein
MAKNEGRVVSLESILAMGSHLRAGQMTRQEKSPSKGQH